MKTWWVKATVRGRGIDRTREGGVFYTLRYTPKVTANRRQYDKLYYVARWAPKKGAWEAMWQSELDQWKQQGYVPFR